MNAFLDTSALAKAYVKEDGSAEVAAVLDEADTLGLSVLATVEMTSLFCRLRREKRMTPKGYSMIKEIFLADIDDASMIDVTESVVGRSVSLMERTTVQSIDALHIASAAEWGCDVFVTADVQQARAAKLAGLTVKKVG
jgi:predicted nucleic acid-binding protein